MWDQVNKCTTYTAGHRVYGAFAGRYEELNCCTGIINLICTIIVIYKFCKPPPSRLVRYEATW